jgi:hypothetical protein
VVSSADAVIAVPLGVAVDRRHLADLHVVLLGAAVALLTDVIAYSLQAEALTKISGRLFSILTSNKPAAGAALGLIFLDQRITAWQWAGIAADAVAAVGAARGSRQRSTTAVMTVAQTRRELTQTPSQHRSASRTRYGTGVAQPGTNGRLCRRGIAIRERDFSGGFSRQRSHVRKPTTPFRPGAWRPLSPLSGEAQPPGPPADVAVAEPAAPTWCDKMVPAPGWT